MLVVFDWDGTLIDSTGKIVRSMHIAAAQVGLPVLEDEAVRNIIGLGLPEAILTLYPQAEVKQRQLLREAYSDVYIKEDAQPCALFAGVEQGLQRLQEAGHYIAVATGKSRRGLDRMLANLDWQTRFDATRCADETASKPDPKMLQELISHFGMASNKVYMVGDTEYDLAMAQRAGVHGIGVSYGAHAAERLYQHQPIAVIDHFAELDNLLL